jgi:hypothetical protein
MHESQLLCSDRDNPVARKGSHEQRIADGWRHENSTPEGERGQGVLLEEEKLLTRTSGFAGSTVLIASRKLTGGPEPRRSSISKHELVGDNLRSEAQPNRADRVRQRPLPKMTSKHNRTEPRPWTRSDVCARKALPDGHGRQAVPQHLRANNEHVNQ